jgi:pantoate--beta-alanine ligase
MSMQVIRSVSAFKNFRSALASSTKIGFVPTMGALHEGHLSLIKQAKDKSDLVICSIFVNPIQFTNASDLKKYPRNLEKDIDLLQNANCDILFAPESEDIYQEKHVLTFKFGELENTMEGTSRPGHFNGVATVVSKLFNIVKPNFAFFGQKDLQQVAVIKDLVKALSFDLEIVRCKTLRNEEGLALSSRNARLSKTEKKEALVFFQTIQLAAEIIKNGGAVNAAIGQASYFFKEKTGFEPEYLKVVFADTLVDYKNEKTQEELAVCIAAPFGPVRLIDNLVFNV